MFYVFPYMVSFSTFPSSIYFPLAHCAHASLELAADTLPLSLLSLSDSPPFLVEDSSSNSLAVPLPANKSSRQPRPSIISENLISRISAVAPPLFSSPSLSPSFRDSPLVTPASSEQFLFRKALSSVNDFFQEISYTFPLDFYSGKLTRPFSVCITNYLASLATQFLQLLYNPPEDRCGLCDRLLYKTSLLDLILTPALKTLLEFHGSLMLPDQSAITVCTKCKTSLSKRQPVLPPQAKFNNLIVPLSPPEISSLSPGEIDLLRRVHPFMKIFKPPLFLGQEHILGSLLHFPKDVSEIIALAHSTDPTLLPQTETTIQIYESHCRNRVCPQFRVSLQSLLSALLWLLENNHL